ncbi:MAG: DUF11 domain-containing protein, partial [Gammaproteobacteria bacterium]|nr:DUF11 domain-containing protein [Gammaproteobacteria bacterium]
FDLALERSESFAGEVVKPEKVAYLAVPNGALGKFFVDVNGDGRPAEELLYEAQLADGIVGWSDGGATVSFLRTYQAPPVVVASKNSRNGGDGGWFRRDKNTPTENEIKLYVDEDLDRDGERHHVAERAGLLAFSDPFHANFKKIRGKIYEDIPGMADPANFVEKANVSVSIYLDDGDGLPNNNDTFINQTTTTSSGEYIFNVASGGTYWIVADSKTVAPDASFNPGFNYESVWAEQTYGARGALCADPEDYFGSSFDGGVTYNDPYLRLDAGPCFGGRRGGVSDDASSLGSAEHIVKVTITNEDINNLDFAFSFNIVVNINDLDDDILSERTAQGSLRQFMQNANSIYGANAMRFVPAINTNEGNGANKWWNIRINLDTFPAIADDETIIDGLAYNYLTGGGQNNNDVRNENTIILQAPGAVGSSAVQLNVFEGPELEININDMENGFVINSNDVVIRNISMYNSPNSWFAAVFIDNAGSQSGSTIENNFIGARADGKDPGLSERGKLGVLFNRHSRASVRHNYIAHLTSSGIWQKGEGELVENLFEHIGFIYNCGDAISLEGANYSRSLDSVIIKLNYIHDIAAYGIESWMELGSYFIEENTITDTGKGDENGNYCSRNSSSDINTSERGGIRLFGDGSIVKNNVLFSIKGNAVVIVPRTSNDPSQYNRITQNIFYENDGLSIDLDQTHTDGGSGVDNPNGDGVTANDGAIDSAQQNYGLDYPIFNSAQIINSGLEIVGYVGTQYSSSYDGEQVVIEVYKADDDGNNNGEAVVGDGLAEPHGEGRWYLGSCNVTLGAGGAFTCTVSVPSAVTLVPGDYVAGIAIDRNGNTSEFGPNQVIHETSPYAGSIVINEVLYRGSGSGNSSAENDEFIEIYNKGNVLVDLSDWQISDGDVILGTQDYLEYTFPSGAKLLPGEYAVIWVGDASAATNAPGAAFQDWLGKGPQLNNAGDDIELFDGQRRLVDYVAYGSGSAVDPPPINGIWDQSRQSDLDGAAQGQSISLTPNGVDGNASNCWELTTSGGAQNSCPGYLPTIDSDAYGSRITSVSRNNNMEYADLDVQKTANPASAGPGDTVTFTITVENHGPNDATGVEVTDTLPSGYTYVSNNPSQGTYNSGAGKWTVGALANGASASLTLTATVNPTGDYTNAAEVTASDQTDPDSTPGDGAGDDYDVVSVTYVPFFDCRPGFYQVLYEDLKLLDPTTGTYTLIGSSADEYNAVGWDIRKNWIYGVGPFPYTSWYGHLLLVGSDGVAHDLGLPVGPGGVTLDALNEYFIAADMDRNGNLYVRYGLTKEDLIKIDVNSLTFEVVDFTGPGAKVGDIVYIEDTNAFWGALNSSLYKWDLNTNQVTSVSVANLPDGVYGAAFTDQQSNLYIANNDGGVYRIYDYDTSTPIAVRVSDSESTARNDGASCPDAPAPFEADLSLTKSVNPTAAGPGDQVTFTLTLTND